VQDSIDKISGKRWHLLKIKLLYLLFDLTSLARVSIPVADVIGQI
jgi:hypothetical protein